MSHTTVIQYMQPDVYKKISITLRWTFHFSEGSFGHIGFIKVGFETFVH